MKYLLATGIIFLLFVSTPAVSVVAATPSSGRFFLMGDGKLWIQNTRTGRETDVLLYARDGSINEKALSEIDRVFGFPTGKDGDHISSRLLAALDYFSDLVAPGRLIHMDSGYRSPRYNARLRKAGGNVAKTSTHMDGLALDFYITGVDGKKLWQIIKGGNCCGVGYYGGRDIHFDTGRPRFWEAATSKVRTGASDFNRKIYLSTDYDRYQAGEKVRLLLSSISNFSFGVKKTFVLVNTQGIPVASSRLAPGDTSGCIPIGGREASHLLSFRLPSNLPGGRYRIKIRFCRRPSEQMPADTLSNEIELKNQR